MNHCFAAAQDLEQQQSPPLPAASAQSYHSQPQPQRRPRGFAATNSNSNTPTPATKSRKEREKEKERTKLRERHRRAITSRMLAGLRQYGNFPLPARADMNDVIAALAREAGWTVEPDGTTCRQTLPAPSLPQPQPLPISHFNSTQQNNINASGVVSGFNSEKNFLPQVLLFFSLYLDFFYKEKEEKYGMMMKITFFFSESLQFFFFLKDR